MARVKVTREQKEAEVAGLVEDLKNSASVVVVDYLGLNVAEVTELLSLIHISEPTRQCCTSRMPSSA